MEKIQLMAGQQQMLATMQRMQMQAAAGAVPLAGAYPGVVTGAPSFSQVLDQAIRHVDGIQHAASAKQRAIEMGVSDDLTGAMLESQKASIAFSALMQVRNKLTQAFDEVINISI